MTTTQAPSRNFVPRRITPASVVSTAPVPLIRARCSHRAGRWVVQCRTRPHLAEREADEDTDREERDQPVRVGVDGDEQHGGQQGQGQHAVAVDRPFGTEPEQMGQAVVAGEQAHQHGQSAAGVRREKQNQSDDQIGGVISPAGAVGACRELGEHGHVPTRGDMVAADEQGETDEHDPEHAPSMSSVRWARLTRGVRKVGTALAMASTPVRAEHPDEKAFITSSSPSDSWAGKDCWVRRRPPDGSGSDRGRRCPGWPRRTARWAA